MLFGGGGTAGLLPGAPLMISALKTSFCGMGAISEGSFAVVGGGVIGSVENVRTSNDERRGTGLARASVQARRSDISSSSSDSAFASDNSPTMSRHVGVTRSGPHI